MYGWGPCDQPPYLTGGFTEFAYVRPECHAVKVPEELDARVLAAATCSLRTVIHGFERLRGLGGQDNVLVLGAGPVGLWTLALAVSSGAAQVIVVGAPAARLRVAEKWGATHTIDLDQVTDSAERLRMIQEWTDGRGPDVVVEAAGPAAAFRDGLEAVRRGGRFLVIGTTDPTPIAINATAFNIRELEVVGVLSGTVPHFYKAVRFLQAQGDRFTFSDMITNTYSLEQTPQALQAMAAQREIKPAIVPA